MRLLLALAPILLLTVIAAIVIVRRQRGRPAPASPDQARAGADGVVAVPILAAMVSGGGLFGGMARNSINPTLALTPEGLAFKVLRQDHWSYAQLTRVHAAKSLLGATLDFKAGGASLNVTVRDLAAARQVLAALPHTVPLSPKASALRDDGTI